MAFNKKAQIGEKRVQGGVLKQKVAPGKWIPVKGAKKGAKQNGKKVGTKKGVGDVIKDKNGSIYMKIGSNRFAPVVENKKGGHTFDSKRKGIQLVKKKDGTLKREEFDSHVGHVVHASNIKAGKDGKYLISDKELKKQSKENIDKVSDLKPGHIVRVKQPETGKTKLGAFEKQGIVGKIRDIKDKIATVIDQYGESHRIPMNSVAFAKSKIHYLLKAKKSQKSDNIYKSMTYSGHKLQGKKKVQGMDISIENRKGSVRSGKDQDGKAWKTKMRIPYGYFLGTQGTDGDHLDTFIGPNINSRLVYIVHINNPKTGKYDEDKVFLGFDDPDDVHKEFNKHYDNGNKYFDSIDEMTITQFKDRAFSKKYAGKKIPEAK
jgi:hypothetical protein